MSFLSLSCNVSKHLFSTINCLRWFFFRLHHGKCGCHTRWAAFRMERPGGIDLGFCVFTSFCRLSHTAPWSRTVMVLRCTLKHLGLLPLIDLLVNSLSWSHTFFNFSWVDWTHLPYICMCIYIYTYTYSLSIYIYYESQSVGLAEVLSASRV